ncbi:Multidrug efflux pump subunit AcrA (membrane-fusion protein) (AcrA) (PDB:1T5E) [Commensalibacter communis]|uniref:Multidrug efflux pump subunit AcrA (Membrane-fusion protein) (AcrA) n=1 Tax=Commensalibacter communis TaxID=2972786 RepID=A0A9W4TNB6_9PROT|nr:efflux RND transporter periplasmic adaptor subunit [Commensalibacter communis]CAI3935531.1 Multidrug efflux pump subunit AcrA (membrane-fusion protein) (AcrA) (PDB:1T5E) [Commensalibacter communis]CAI3937477.1 Multidrug efflux pump subunit AcrA (membrane-fusion protein) (AcrA) (PDB:1T5E) [Commensalibacter communis]CAI3942686.1 Multidrug efflux pump subunit AcrA (membrane-fusion protein) (AcrA) (PDB:1T5E) [Commensalibacter communis]CAI3942843.1 Multidrug efflux pump subunit AcrA (membrane-fus
MTITDSFFTKWHKECAVLCVLLLPLAACKEQKPAPKPSAKANFVIANPQDVELLIDLTGRITPMRVSEVRPQVNGYLYKRLFEEGTDVTKDQQLYQVDPRPYQAALDNAQGKLNSDLATLRAQTLKLKRYGPLKNMDAVSRQDYDDTLAAQEATKATIESDRASVRQAQLDLEYTGINATISGRISRSIQTQGALMATNQANPVAIITQLDPMFVDIIQPTAEQLRLRSRLANGKLETLRGAAHVPVDLILEDNTRYPLQANLLFTEVVTNQETGSVIQRAIVRNPDKLLLSGMYVRTVMHEGMEKAFLIPQEAVMRGLDEKPYLYIINKDNVVERRDIETQRMQETFWVTTKGVNAGDKILVSNPTSYRPGQKVQPEEGRTPVGVVPQ